MSDAAVVVWLDHGATADETRALGAWAAARGLRLSPPDEPTAGPPADPGLADRIEHELARAYEALGGADADLAERALARADELLRDHPELLAAPWLRAEVERAWAARWLRGTPRDEARARAASENADAIDGGRVAGVGETAFPPRPRVRTAIAVTGPIARLELRVDGTPRPATATRDGGATYGVELAPGEHHVLGLVSGRVAFASWVAVTADAAPIQVTISDGGACGRADVGRARRSTIDPQRIEAGGVACPSWVAAAAGERPGSVLVARCEGEACGPLLEWRTERLVASGPPQAETHRKAWPSWATWTIVGIGAATATSVALVATGVFEARRVETRFVVGGARQE